MRECVRQNEAAALHSLEPVQRLDRTHLLVQLQGVMTRLCVVDLEHGTSRALAVTGGGFCGACAGELLFLRPPDWRLLVVDWRGDEGPSDLELHSTDAAVQPTSRAAAPRGWRRCRTGTTAPSCRCRPTATSSRC
jgi:hypothetical protein